MFTRFQLQYLISDYSRAHVYQSSSLIWTLNFNSNFFKRTNYFYRLNDSQNKKLLESNFKYTMQRFKKFPKKSRVDSALRSSCEAHPQKLHVRQLRIVQIDRQRHIYIWAVDTSYTRKDLVSCSFQIPYNYLQKETLGLVFFIKLKIYTHELRMEIVTIIILNWMINIYLLPRLSNIILYCVLSCQEGYLQCPPILFGKLTLSAQLGIRYLIFQSISLEHLLFTKIVESSMIECSGTCARMKDTCNAVHFEASNNTCSLAQVLRSRCLLF